MQNFTEHKIGLNKGAPRVWIQGRQPASAGFLPGVRYTVEVKREQKSVVLRLVSNGERGVTGKEKDGTTVPVIDLNSNETLSIFSGLERVRVIALEGELHIMPLASQIRVDERLGRLREKIAKGLPLAMGSLCHGGGVLSLAMHDGFCEGGLKSNLAFANDIRPELLEHASLVNPAWSSKTVAVAAPMQELAFDHWSLAHLPKVDILEAGIPCEGASLSGRAKNGTSCAEAHEDVGHLAVAFLSIIARVNPAVVVLENVPPYQSSASMWIIRHQMRDLGYIVHETLLEGAEWNALEHRKRMCMVAVTVGMEFDFAELQKPEPKVLRLGDVLDDIALDDPCWSPMEYLKDKAVRDAEAGKGFAMQIVTPESTQVGTIGKGYQKNRSTEPKVQHPENPDLLRLLTPEEHARVKGIKELLVRGIPKTLANELLGQSILPAPFKAIASLIARKIRAWFGTNNEAEFSLCLAA